MMSSKMKWLVVLTLLLGAILLFAGLFFWQGETERVDVLKMDPQASLGEAGAVCGGERRLPCRPGSSCVITDMAKEEGVCVKGEIDPGVVRPAGRQ